MLLTALLAVTLCQMAEDERDLSFSVELTGGRQLGAAGYVDYGVLPSLYLNAGYSLFKPPALPATDTSPAVPTAATHILSGGVDWTPGRHFSLSVFVSGSPKATDVVVLNPNAPVLVHFTVSTWRSSLGGSLAAAWMSGGLSKFEWMIDASASVTANKLGRAVQAFGTGTFEEDDLLAYRGSAGLTLTLVDRTDVSLRGGINAYSAHPLTAGRFSEAEVLAIARGLSAGASELTRDLEIQARAAQQAATRLGQADSLSGYASAPLFAEVKIQVLHRFTSKLSGQVGWTFNRYVPTAGSSNVFSSRVTVKLGSKWRVWAGGAVQRDEPLDHPAQRQASDPQPSISGLVTVGGELTL